MDSTTSPEIVNIYTPGSKEHDTEEKTAPERGRSITFETFGFLPLTTHLYDIDVWQVGDQDYSAYELFGIVPFFGMPPGSFAVRLGIGPNNEEVALGPCCVSIHGVQIPPCLPPGAFRPVCIVGANKKKLPYIELPDCILQSDYKGFVPVWDRGAWVGCYGMGRRVRV